MTYETPSASFLAIRALHQLVDDERSICSEAADIIKRDFYVEDMITGTRTYDEAFRIRDGLIDITHKGVLNLRQWVSNNKGLLADLTKLSTDTHIRLDLEETTPQLSG